MILGKDTWISKELQLKVTVRKGDIMSYIVNTKNLWV